MAPLDWSAIEGVKADSLSEEKADELYDILKDGKVGDDYDVAKLKHLFDLTQAVMVNRNLMLEDAMAEAEAEAKKALKKEQELKKEVDKAEKQVEELKKYGPAEGSGSQTTRYFREQMRELEENNDQLKQEVSDLNRDLNGEKRAAEKYSERISELEKELKDTREENDQMRQDISDYKMQMQTQRDSIVSRRGEDAEFKEKLGKKNRELAETMEELQNMTDANDLLQKRCEDLQHNLEDAVQQMDRTSEDYLKLKSVLQQSDAVTDALREENEILKNQVQDLTEQVQSKGEADDAIMVAVHQKVDEWREIMQEKDQQISDLQEHIFKLKEQLIASNMDSDKASVSALSEVLKDKDKQIAELTDKVNQFTAEMERNSAVIDDLKHELHRTGSNQGDRMQTRMRELQDENKYLKEQTKRLGEDVKKADEDCRTKDKELSELLERMSQYEGGEYGLPEAVAEIKEGKNQVKIREREIEELTAYINKTELKINEILDENEELRYKLGMDPREPLDLTSFRKNKAIRQEELKAVNFTLQREIEALEEERIEDKKKIRKLAQQVGQRAVALGLTAEDMMAVQNYTETLKTKRRTEEEQQSAAVIIRQQVQREEGRIRGQELDKDYKENIVELHKLETENSELKSKNQQLRQDNESLEAGLKEVMEALQKGAADGKYEVGDMSQNANTFPTIERMLAAIEAKKVLGSYDTSYFLKEQVDVLKGRNEELRATLREVRVEASKTALERDKAFERLEKMDKEEINMGEVAAGRGFVSMGKLPDGMAPSSAEVIASLNEHLLLTLQELSQRETALKTMGDSLESYKRKYAVLRHQQGLLYQEYIDAKKEWQEDMEKNSKQLQELQGQKDEDRVRIQEFDRLCETLSHDDVEVRRRLSEMTRRITVLRVNEKALTRRYQTMEEVEVQLRKEVNRARNEMNQMETAVSERMGYLQRYKDMAAFKMAALQKALEDSVPSSDLEKVNKQYHNITEKYRDLLEKGNSLVSKAEALEGMEAEVKQLTAEKEVLSNTLTMEKEKLHALEAAMEELHRRGVTGEADGQGPVSVTDGDIISISKKITMLEMKELNERQRAEHAARMYDQQRALLSELGARNTELEEKFAELQVSEGQAVKRLEEAQKKVIRFEAQALRQEQRLDDKEQAVYHSRQEAQSKTRYLRRALQDLRIQFAGSVPMSRQEKFAKAMVQLQQDKSKMEADLREARSKREEMEDQVAALSLQQTSLQELLATLKDGRGAQKVAEWHAKIDGLRLDELKQRRNNSKLQQQIKYLEEIIRSHEVTISDLEADNVRMIKDYEEKQMRWELREAELERTIVTMEKNTAEIAGAASKFEAAISALPNAKLPVANQLEQAISTIKGNVKVILDTQAENKAMKSRNQELEKQVREMERGLLERDRLISELRLRMPATAERDEVITKAQAKVTAAVQKAEDGGGDFESHQALKIAQSTVHSLQQRIQQKDETLAKYQQLLRQGREDLVEMNKRHEEELRAMQQKLHLNTDLAFSKFKDAARELIHKQATPGKSVTAQQLTRLNELEDIVAEQENTIAALHEKVKQKEAEILHLQASLQISNNNLKSEHNRLTTETNEQLGKKESELGHLSQENQDLRREVHVLKEEVEALKDSNQRGPSASMKAMVERLKNQLALKEKQHQALSKALSDLRADMVTQAEQNVAVHAQESSQERNIQKLIDEHTKDYAEQLEEQQGVAERLKKEVKKRKENETQLQTELEDVKEELNKKERTVVKLKASKSRLEGEVDDMEKKLEKISAARSQKAGDFEKQQELDDMRRKCRALEDQLSRQLAAEKPYEQKEDRTKAEDAIRWEESKKWQRTVEKMKNKIKEKESEISELNATINRLKALLERSNREREIHRPIQKSSSHSLGTAPSSNRLDHEREDLKATIYRQQEEIGNLKRQALLSQDAAMQEVQMRNQHLREQLEQMERAMAARPPDSSVSASEYQKVFNKNQDLQREVLKLTEEAMELRFEVESSRKDIPRLKERVEDLQSYVEALKFENSQLAGDSARSSLSSIKRTQMEDMRQTMGLELSERYTAQQKGTAKMVNDFDKMRKELAKEKEENERLRVKVRSLEVQGEHQDKELVSTRSRLEMETAKKPSMATLDSQGWKSAVQTRMYEEKIRSMEADLEKKSKQLKDNKILLRDAAEREQALLKEKDDMLQKITDSVLDKASHYDRVTRENIELKMELKSVELEREKFRREMEKLKKELGNFGPDFFEEIEDLKYNYKQSVQRNVLLEEKIHQVERQFGISIDID
ncbi:centrosomal protein of 290 kDa [Elysia marginata]|uniref:Centrosomal protein of 290 kDa n=1 Tax=Elysia marginata TaxID=1093978 RepID=A0AAV4FH45_9GAST|nr:centrosomal protein of 290 kDa [Elysia marginata]